MGTGGQVGGEHFNDRSVAEQNEKDTSPRMSSIAPSTTGNNNNNQPISPSANGGLNFGNPTWRAAPSEIGTDVSEPMSIHSQRTQPWVVEQLFVAGAKAILGQSQEDNPVDSDETKEKENMSRGLQRQPSYIR